ncbi:hypothetical protein CDAR_586881 [Caerostris darwini]|uniref:Uncharacterized protein n=1 Tax=Caerostris darwini TaxID=1538125 RepID=A0AAV4T3K8_9ARAC|nr:hypothetical protein CDAR_586881 [Caerostris darwini]
MFWKKKHLEIFKHSALPRCLLCPKTSGEPISLAELAGTFHFWKPNENTSRMESSTPRFARDLGGRRTGSFPRSRGSTKSPFFSSSGTTGHRNRATYCSVCRFSFLLFYSVSVAVKLGRWQRNRVWNRGIKPL